MEEGRIRHLLESVHGGGIRYTDCNKATDLAQKQLFLLDTVGLLASVYGYAIWSYIGGGFGVGIHNTLEAATFALPIAFGPRYQKFKEARDLISIGAACSVTNYEELAAWFAPPCATRPKPCNAPATLPATTRVSIKVPQKPSSIRFSPLQTTHKPRLFNNKARLQSGFYYFLTLSHRAHPVR